MPAAVTTGKPRYHGLRVTRENYLRENPIAEAATEVDVFLPDDGHVVRPDISILLKENLHIVKTHIHGVPDITVEISSPSTAHADLGEKADRYLGCGVKEYWIIDREEKTVQIWSNRGDHWLKQTGAQAESKILPGLTLRASDIWR
jgi:Uma2 family endonuclease